jgi:hypothetical protein
LSKSKFCSLGNRSIAFNIFPECIYRGCNVFTTLWYHDIPVHLYLNTLRWSQLELSRTLNLQFAANTAVPFVLIVFPHFVFVFPLHDVITLNMIFLYLTLLRHSVEHHFLIFIAMTSRHWISCKTSIVGQPLRRYDDFTVAFGCQPIRNHESFK